MSTTTNGGMPERTSTPMPAGSTSTMNAAQINQQNSTSKQMSLISQNGGASSGVADNAASTSGDSGGTIEVGGTPSYAPNQSQNAANMKGLTSLSAQSQENARYDGGDSTNANLTGGNRRKKRGGMSWKCLSGGKKKRRKHKTRKTKRIKIIKRTKKTRRYTN